MIAFNSKFPPRDFGMFSELNVHLCLTRDHFDSLSLSWLKNIPADSSLLLIKSHLAIEDLLPTDPRLLDHALERPAIKQRNLIAEEHGLLVNLELGLIVEHDHVAIKPDIDVALVLL